MLSKSLISAPLATGEETCDQVETRDNVNSGPGARSQTESTRYNSVNIDESQLSAIKIVSMDVKNVAIVVHFNFL